jgi:hypothetical protein
MPPSLVEYLRGIESQAAGSDLSRFYLWPRTPIGEEIQDRIRERVGVGDLEVENPESRPATILRFLRDSIERSSLPVDSTVLDVACGDALVLLQLKKAVPALRAFGLDCNKGKFPSHAQAEAAEVPITAGYIQHLFATPPPVPFDVVLMLNTYRGWESADLRPHEAELPEMADEWFSRSARVVILTATKTQARRLMKKGWTVGRIGKGEGGSIMIALSRDAGLVDTKIWPAPRSWF